MRRPIPTTLANALSHAERLAYNWDNMSQPGSVKYMAQKGHIFTFKFSLSSIKREYYGEVRQGRIVDLSFDKLISQKWEIELACEYGREPVLLAAFLLSETVRRADHNDCHLCGGQSYLGMCKSCD